MLEDLIEKYTAKADKPVHFSLYLESEWVYADEEFLKEAIGNLVDNSIKYSGEEVDIQISSLRQDYNFYLIKVRDNGIGIPLKDQSRISRSTSVLRLPTAAVKAVRQASDWV